MLGSVADAEDMLQEAFIRWQLASNEEVRSAKAFLVTVITRLCVKPSTIGTREARAVRRPMAARADRYRSAIRSARRHTSRRVALDGAARPLRTLDRGRAGSLPSARSLPLQVL